MVDAPLYGSILRVLEWTVSAQDRLGYERHREGNRMASSAPLDNYPTKDGTYVCIVAGSNVNFSRLCAAMGRPEMADDPQWASLAQRAARSDEINDLVADWTRVAHRGRGRGRLHRPRGPGCHRVLRPST